jgi:hypothetical protein
MKKKIKEQESGEIFIWFYKLFNIETISKYGRPRKWNIDESHGAKIVFPIEKEFYTYTRFFFYRLFISVTLSCDSFIGGAWPHDF